MFIIHVQHCSRNTVNMLEVTDKSDYTADVTSIHHFQAKNIGRIRVTIMTMYTVKPVLSKRSRDNPKSLA